MPDTAKTTAAKPARKSPAATAAAHRPAAQEAGKDLEAQRQERIAARDAQAAAILAVRGEHATVWDALAAPFPQEDLERLPRNLRKDDQDKGRCEDTNGGRRYSADGHYCGGWHARSVHLDYVGHAGITTRLNDVVGPANWDLQPMAFTAEGLPLMVRGEFWARLTVLGVTKMDLATNYSSTQEALGDVLRRAAMRFGVGTYLWSKSEAALALKRATDDVEPEPAQERQREAPEPQPQAPATPPPWVVILQDRISALDDEGRKTLADWWPTAMWHGQPLPPLVRLSQQQAAAVSEQVAKLEDPWASRPGADDAPNDQHDTQGGEDSSPPA